MSKIKVLIVDDSAIVRKLLADALSDEENIEVVGAAPDPFVARDKILALKPDVLTLDIEMPRMDGLTFLRKLMRYHPMPVVVISSLGVAGCQAAIDALRIGAVEVLAKPGGPYSVGELKLEIAAKIRAAAAARIRKSATEATHPPAPQPARATPLSGAESRAVIAIGASTGGTEAIQDVLTQLPAAVPPVVITQHIPPVFSLAFAKRLNEICSIEVKEAEEGDLVLPGRALIAPGNFHMVLGKSAHGLRVTLNDGLRVCYQRPSVDVMFSSVAETVGPRAVGVVLTGMGADGARGLVKMREAGARTLAQDEASSVVFGMPREAIRLGGAESVVSLGRMPGAILDQLRRIGG